MFKKLLSDNRIFIALVFSLVFIGGSVMFIHSFESFADYVWKCDECNHYSSRAVHRTATIHTYNCRPGNHTWTNTETHESMHTGSCFITRPAAKNKTCSQHYKCSTCQEFLSESVHKKIRVDDYYCCNKESEVESGITGGCKKEWKFHYKYCGACLCSTCNLIIGDRVHTKTYYIEYYCSGGRHAYEEIDAEYNNAPKCERISRNVEAGNTGRLYADCDDHDD